MSHDFTDAETSQDAIERARRRAKTRVPIREPIEVLSEDKLEAPIDEESEEPAVPAMPPICVLGYQLLGETGAGGQATVFRAVQESTGRVVALKVLPGGPLAGRQARGRFGREAEILAKLDHPNVVRIIDRCETQDGSLVLVMDYIEGDHLNATWKAPAHPGRAAEIATLFVCICDGVGEAHRHGIVHRDLKPSNILLDRRGAPRILDFGLAQLTMRKPEMTLTGPGQMVGSLPWASPEQVSARSIESLSASTDVYSIGVMLYEALTGRPPYVTTGSMHEVITAIQRSTPIPPQTVPGAKERGVDAVLGSIVLKAINKNPGERYSDAAEFGEDLRRWLAGHRPVAQYAERRKLITRWRSLLLLAIGISALVFVALVFAPLHDEPKPGTIPSPIHLPEFTNSVGMRFVAIPPGKLVLGSPRSAPGHRDDEPEIAVGFRDAVWISAYEVTRDQYRKVMGGLPPLADTNREGTAPVDGVLRDDARRFCKRLSQLTHQDCRLPTSSEWEYACKDSNDYRSFSGTDNLNEMGWYAGNSGMQIHPVGQKRPNAYGLFDMHGNVAEWVDDNYSPTGRSSDQNPLLWEIRGGSAFDAGDRCRTAARAGADPNVGVVGVGFRVVIGNGSTTGPSTHP